MTCRSAPGVDQFDAGRAVFLDPARAIASAARGSRDPRGLKPSPAIEQSDGPGTTLECIDPASRKRQRR